MPVLIIPGAFTRASSFDRLARRLRAHVVELPLRGRRLPQLDVGGLRAADRAVAKAIATIPYDGAPLVLVGHSMGGLLALRASRREEVDGLVLAMPAPPGGLIPELATMALRDPASAAKFAALCLSTLPARLGTVVPPRGLYTADVATDVLEAAKEHRVDESLSVLLQLLIGTRAEVAPSAIPTLVLGGSQDGLIPAATVQVLADRLGADHEEHPVAHNFSEEPAGVVVEDGIERWLLDKGLWETT